MGRQAWCWAGLIDLLHNGSSPGRDLRKGVQEDDPGLEEQGGVPGWQPSQREALGDNYLI